MFTGIITAIGRLDIRVSTHAGDRAGLHVAVQTPPEFLHGVVLGDSIAVNGACMTVTHLKNVVFEVDVSAESLAKTAPWLTGAEVNLEKALRMGDALGGHMVSGHVDGTGCITRLEVLGESRLLEIRCPAAWGPCLAPKGSVTVQGISLTINDVQDTKDSCIIRMNIIPHTLQHTTLCRIHPGDLVNIELDAFARQVERVLSHRKQRTENP